MLFFGSVVPPEVVAQLPVASEAANRYQLGVLEALRAAGVDRTIAVTALATPAWPASRSLMERRRHWAISPGIDVVAPSFVNVRPVKPLSLELALTTAGIRASARLKPDVIVTYNPTPGHGSAALRVARRLRVRLVTIVADLTPPNALGSAMQRALARYGIRVIRRSDALVVLNGHVIADFAAPGTPWMKLDGGVTGNEVLVPHKPADQSIEKRFVFSSSLVESNGLRLVLDAFALLKEPTARLVVTGRGPLAGEVEARASVDPRVELKGFLPRPDLERLYQSAVALVNPRLTNFPENQYNFPAKLLDYLATGRPVMSTFTGDIDPAFRDVVIPIDTETPAGLAAVLADVCSWPANRLTELGVRGRELALSSRSWDVQGARLKKFLDAVPDTAS